MILVSELIDSPEKWTRQTYFRNENGKSCHKQDAVQYSLSGALHILRWRLCLFYYGIIYELLVLEIMHSWPERFNPDLPIFSFNDHPDTTYDDVMKLCERIGV